MARSVTTPWKRPNCYMGKEWPDWYVGVGRTRDSSCLERVNFEVFHEEVLKASNGLSIMEPDMGWDGKHMEIDSVYIVRESHWLVGWVEWIAIHKDDKGALAKANELLEKLDGYPVLNEDRWSEEEEKEIADYWISLSISERVEYCRDAGDSIFAARHDWPPTNTYYWIRDTWQ